MHASTPTARPTARGGRALALLIGIGIGAGLVYFLDRNGSGGAFRPVSGRLDPGDSVDDAIVLERVRAALADVIADPLGVDIRVRYGTVTLKGPATAEQIAEMVACASRVRGVRTVENRLSPNG